MDERPEWPELLAHLTARAAPAEFGVKARPQFLGVEMAGMLARLSPGAQRLALFRYLDDRSVLGDLAALAANGLAWQNHGGLVRVALEECLELPVCRRCQGRRSARVGARWVDCPACDGSGRGRVTQAERARRLGMSRQGFASAWSERYGRLLDGLRIWLAQLDDEIAAKLRLEFRGLS